LEFDVTSRETIAAVIPVKNVAHFIKPTMDSLTWCDEVVIVDMFSTDDTKKICTSYENCKFLERESFIYDNVNYGIDNAESKWILRLDSDEVVTEELKKEILEKVISGTSQFDGYEAQSNLYFFGQLLRYGFGRNNWRTTIFKKGIARYEAKSEHEEMKREGTWGRLEHRYDHFTNPSISMWVNKINYYSDRDLDRWDPEKDPDKMTFPKMLYRTLRWFQRFYIYPGMSYRDGKWGLVVSLIAAGGLLLEYLKQWEKQEHLKDDPNIEPIHPNTPQYINRQKK
jgi:glycosyltransferase involved in cell wall biosynthesis